MLSFDASLFGSLVQQLTWATAVLTARIVAGHGQSLLDPETRHLTSLPLDNFLTLQDVTFISPRMRTKIKGLFLRVVEDEALTVNTAETLYEELSNDLFIELEESYFLMIPSQRKQLYEQPWTQPFDEGVMSRFPETSDDIRAAARCIALDEWTAAVFHLMRVLERGLHALASDIGLSTETDVELKNWGNIIDRIEKEIRKQEQAPKSQEKSERLKFSAQAASNFWYFKEAWRNHVSHSRATYDEKEALSVFTHVGGFMAALAAGLPEC